MNSTFEIPQADTRPSFRLDRTAFGAFSFRVEMTRIVFLSYTVPSAVHHASVRRRYQRDASRHRQVFLTTVSWHYHRRPVAPVWTISLLPWETKRFRDPDPDSVERQTLNQSLDQGFLVCGCLGDISTPRTKNTTVSRRRSRGSEK